MPENKCPLSIDEKLQKIFYIGEKELPGNILISDDIESEYLKDKSVKIIENINNRKILGYLMNFPKENLLLILPEELFKYWSKILISKSRNIEAFSVSFCTESYDLNYDWFIDIYGKIHLPKELDDETSKNSNSEIKDILLNRETQIEKSLIGLLKNSKDEEAVHKTRVNSRTLRSILDFLKPWTDGEKNKKMRDILKNLAKDFSDIREEDVLIKHISQYQAENNSLNHFNEIIELMKEKRNTSLTNLLTKIITENVLSIIPALKSELESLMIFDSDIARKINQKYFNEMINFQIAAENNDYYNHDKTHNLRKEAKKMRYVMENLSRYITSVDENVKNQFKYIQTELGELCDARINQIILKNLNESSNMEFQEDLEKLIEFNQLKEIELIEKFAK